MKAWFFLKSPPDGGEAVEYVNIDPDDTGKQVVGRQASDADRERFPEEYQKFREEQEEAGNPSAKGAKAEREKATKAGAAPAPGAPLSSKEPLTGPATLDAAVPVTVQAAAPLGREEEFTAQVTGKAPKPDTRPPVQRMAIVDDPDAAADGEDGGEDGAEPGFALADMNAEEAKAEISSSNDPAELQAWKKEEKAGKNRVTVLDAIDHRLDQVKNQG